MEKEIQVFEVLEPADVLNFPPPSGEGPWKLIGNRDKATQLVNLDDAKPEQHNYLREQPELARRLRKLHDDWMTSTR